MRRAGTISILLVIAALLFSLPLSAQRVNRGLWYQEWSTDEHGDSIPHLCILPVAKYAKRGDMRRYAKMIRAVKKVYPIAQTAKREMENLEGQLLQMKSRKERREFIKGVQQRIIKDYTPVLKKMTRYEGRILLKLIDRETKYTAYQIVKELRGGFVAGFWQTVARIFGNNLKLDYDPEHRDRVLEKIVVYYEMGYL